ncbi:DUF3592 domain-containing protein [Aquipseudomonas ullengensis]|uniref:DUF3592 domain-containing protein n=1 Tax=Aquipseudomonas ullengensis TaxID=2759166 RepID=A0A7W4LKL6_9GAMM|nr:DUF3592 domain-containing protein [Pseudomonas ullengensis]MBB2494914.1 DUF3592 domain-containing protein [Pseudomonas ullengensis]
MDSFAAVYRTFELAASGDGKSLALLAAIYVSAVMLSSAIYLRLIWHWPSTTGQLIRQEVATFGGKEYVQSQQNYLAKVEYTYEVDGQRYTGNRLSPWKVMASANARIVLQAQMQGIDIDSAGGVTVYYNPRKPTKSYLIRSGPIKQTVTLLAGVAPLIAYAWYFGS